MDTHRVSDQLLVDAAPLEKFQDNEQLVGTCRNCEGEEIYDEKEAQKRREVTKQSRRHNWQPKYKMEFGLLAIERDAVSGDVLLAMCGFCKAFGREGKYEKLVRQDQEAGNDSKKRRRRSLTTTKFFRAFRVDNVRSHLQGAHPRRWAEFELLPKQEAIRARYLHLHGELQPYDHLPMVDDVVLGGSALHAEADMTYAQALAQASVISEAQHAAVQAAAQVVSAQAPQMSTGPNGINHSTTQMTASLTYNAFGAASSAASASTNARGTFDYEKHLTEQTTLDRERLEFEKMQFKKEVELRERELALREKHMEQKIALHEKLCEANRESARLESVKFYRLAEVLRDVISGAQSSSETASVV